MTNEEIESILDEGDTDALLKLVDDPAIEETEKADVITRILRALEEQFYEGLPELAVKVCVETPKKVAWVARHSFLSYWLKGQGYYDRPTVIKSVVNRLKSETNERLEAAIRTAWVIGYRDDQIVDELENIAGLHKQTRPDTNAEGWALAVLASMAYPRLDFISSKLKSRLNVNGLLTESDCWTAKHAATPEMISGLVEAAPSQLLAVSALLDLPTRYPDSAKAVFDAFKSLEEKDRFLYVNNLTSNIDLPDVGVYVLDQVLGAFEQPGKRNVLPPVNQLLNANKPNQLSSFTSARETLAQDERECLSRPAIRPTGNVTDFQTSESVTKEAAWSVILRLGLKEAREWLPAALEGEENFTLLKLAEFASFIGVEKAVSPLSRIALDEKADYRIGLGCLKSLGVIGTADALDVLLKSRVHRQKGGNDEVPLALVEAIASACMTQKSCDVVWNRLRDPNSSVHLQKLCAYVIEDLSSFINAPLPDVTELTDLLGTEDLSFPGYDSLLLALPRYQHPVALDLLRQVGASNHQSNELTQALAVSGLLIDFPNRIEALGLKKDAEHWVITKTLSATGALALLCLYRSDKSFESAIIKVLEGDSLHLATQIVANLRNSDALSPPVRQALFNRALNWNGSYYADPLSLEALARTWAEPLLEESFIEKVSLWQSSARRAYLSSLKVALGEGCNSTVIAQLACRFLVDDESDVRRDAARLALESNSLVLKREVHALAKQQDPLDHAIFLLDAAFWLDSDWQEFAQFGASHREPLVREHCKTLSRERDELLLARDYLLTVLKSTDYLDTWCYGQALLEVGKEETIDLIYAGLPSEVYRRSYLIWLAKELKARLEKARNDQSSKHYLPPPAASEKTLEVSIEVDSMILGTVLGVLAETYSRRAHRWLWSWTVLIENQPELIHTINSQGSGKPVYVKVDGRRGQVLPASSKIGSGSEPYSRLIMQGTGPLEEV